MLTATSCCAETDIVTGSLLTSAPGAIETDRRPPNVSRTFDPGTSRAAPGAMGRPIQASLTLTAVDPNGLPSRTRSCRTGADTRAISRTVASGDVPCTPSSDASQTPSSCPTAAKAVGVDAAAAAELVAPGVAPTTATPAAQTAAPTAATQTPTRVRGRSRPNPKRRTSKRPLPRGLSGPGEYPEPPPATAIRARPVRYLPTRRTRALNSRGRSRTPPPAFAGSTGDSGRPAGGRTGRGG